MARNEAVIFAALHRIAGSRSNEAPSTACKLVGAAE